MPRAFTPDETERIRARLKEAAREAFGRRGVRGTTVEELAKAAAISKGAFYRFYASKEELLIELLADAETSMHAEIEAAVRADPVRGVEVVVDAAVHAIERNPLLVVLMSPEGLHVLQSLSAPEQEEFLQRDERLVERVMTVLREAGAEPALSADLLLGLLRSLVFVGLHREEIGPKLVDEVAGWLAQNVRAALFVAPERGTS